MKLIKLTDDNYVVVDETIQPVNGYYYDSFINKIKSTNGAEYGEASHCWQITHSTQPLEEKQQAPTHTDNAVFINFNSQKVYDKIKPLSLQEVKELIGEVDLENKAFEYTSASQAHRRGFIDGYNQALEDNKEKKYTEEDMSKAIEFGYDLRNNHKPINSGIDWVKILTQSLQPKTQWEVEWETIDNRELCDCSCHNNPNMIHFVACCNDGWIGKITQKLKLL